MYKGFLVIFEKSFYSNSYTITFFYKAWAWGLAGLSWGGRLRPRPRFTTAALNKTINNQAQIKMSCCWFAHMYIYTRTHTYIHTHTYKPITHNQHKYCVLFVVVFVFFLKQTNHIHHHGVPITSHHVARPYTVTRRTTKPCLKACCFSF